MKLSDSRVNNVMTSNRPYLIRALYEWITDNGLTPHLLVNAEQADVEVPQQYINEGRIVLNINPSAVRGLQLGNEWIEFSARFSGTPHVIRVPVGVVVAIYARENGQGMVFSETTTGDQPPPPASSPGGKKPTLKVVK
jgi:stringent starvation protein B